VHPPLVEAAGLYASALAALAGRGQAVDRATTRIHMALSLAAALLFGGDFWGGGGAPGWTCLGPPSAATPSAAVATAAAAAGATAAASARSRPPPWTWAHGRRLVAHAAAGALGGTAGAGVAGLDAGPAACVALLGGVAEGPART